MIGNTTQIINLNHRQANIQQLSSHEMFKILRNFINFRTFIFRKIRPLISNHEGFGHH